MDLVHSSPMDFDVSDLFPFVSSYKATTFTTPTSIFETPSQTPTTTTTATNNIISPQNITPFYFDDFSFTQDNNPVPFSQLKQNNFIDLDKFKINFNPTTTLPAPILTTTSIPTIITTTTSSQITNIPTPLTTTILSHITCNTTTSVHGSKQNFTFFDCPTLIEQQQVKSSDHELERLIFKINPDIPTPTCNINTPTITSPTTPTRITPMTTTPAMTIFTPTTITSPTNITSPTTPTRITTMTNTPTMTIFTPTTTTSIIPTTTTTNLNNIITSVHGTKQYPTISDYAILIKQQEIQLNNNNQVLDHANNHPFVRQPPRRELNQLSILLPNTYSSVLPNTDPQKAKTNSRKRKINNKVKLECHVRADKLSEDWWAWRKYGQKNIKGSPHPRSYFKCNSSKDCLAKKLVEKSNTKEDTYVVTFVGAHNHEKPARKRKSIVGTSHNKSSKTRLSAVENARLSPNVAKFGSTNVRMMMRFDHPKSKNIQIFSGQSEETELIATHLPAAGEAETSPNVENLCSPNVMRLQFDDPKSSNAQVYTNEPQNLHSEAKFIGSIDDDEEIWIQNMANMSDDFLLDFNLLNGGVLFP